MVGHGGSSAGSYLADPTSPIPSHCASIVATSTLRGKYRFFMLLYIDLIKHTPYMLNLYILYFWFKSDLDRRTTHPKFTWPTTSSSWQRISCPRDAHFNHWATRDLLPWSRMKPCFKLFPSRLISSNELFQMNYILEQPMAECSS